MILTYNLRRYFSFKKIEDLEMEKKIEGARKQKERLEDMTNDHPVRKILKGLRERIAREVYDKSALENLESVDPDPAFVSNNTAEPPPRPRRKSLLFDDDFASPIGGGSKTKDKSLKPKNAMKPGEDPINASLCNGSVVAQSPKKSLMVKNLNRSSSNLSASSILSLSDASIASEAGITSGADTARSSKNIWDKLQTTAANRRRTNTASTNINDVRFPTGSPR